MLFIMVLPEPKFARNPGRKILPCVDNNLKVKGRFHKLVRTQGQTVCALCPTFENIFLWLKNFLRAQKIGVGCKM